MGKVLSVVNRQINRFNAENRAHRFIEKDKPIAAPRHPSTVKHFEQITSESSQGLKEYMMKHEVLDNNLKRIYVKSHGAPPLDLRRPSEKSKLPVNRFKSPESELGYEEPEIIPEGKVTLKQAIEIINNHKEDSYKFSVPHISEKYKLSEQDTINLLKYFSSFKIHIPKKLSTEARRSNLKVFLAPSMTNLEQKKLNKGDTQKLE